MANTDQSQIVFVQFQQPGLKDGAYHVHAEISVTDPKAPGFPPVDKYLRIKGDRFALSPNSVAATYPPDKSGDFSASLPHAVLNRPTLPWERVLSATAPESAPWMAVLLLTEAELVAEMLDPSHPTVLSTKQDEGVSISCSLLTISNALWSRVAPALAELPYLAHVRRVETVRKADNVKETVDYGLVIGNRLPPPGQSCRAFLISLEGLADKLPPATLPAGTITLTVFESWRFFAKAETHTFGDAISALDRSSGLSLPHTATGPAQVPLSMGFLPAPHDLRVGGQTVSWYRGPFAPYGTGRKIGKLPVAWADGLTLYDPDLGMMDVSCSSAWALGRLLALNDSTFATTLYKWKRGVSRDTIERAEYEMLSGVMPPAGPVSVTLRAGIERNLASGLAAALGHLGGLKNLPRPQGMLALQSPPPVARLTVSQRTQSLQQTLADPSRIARLHHLDVRVNLLRATAAPVQPDTPETVIAKWLGDLMLLKNVPIHYLIPDARMLPPDSIRFFQVDLAWLQALLDGAFSIGRVTASDNMHDVAFTPVIDSGAARATAVARPQARRLLAGQNAPALLKPVSGFLLRSDAVTHWPDMEVDGSASGQPAITLRQEKLGSLLLCLFDRKVDTVAIHQPSEGVHFGFHQTGTAFTKYRRRTQAEGSYPAGSEITTNPLTEIPYRNPGSTVLDVASLVNWFGAATTNTADRFAFQMVTGVDRIVFTIS